MWGKKVCLISVVSIIAFFVLSLTAWADPVPWSYEEYYVSSEAQVEDYINDYSDYMFSEDEGPPLPIYADSLAENGNTPYQEAWSNSSADSGYVELQTGAYNEPGAYGYSYGNAYFSFYGEFTATHPVFEIDYSWEYELDVFSSSWAYSYIQNGVYIKDLTTDLLLYNTYFEDSVDPNIGYSSDSDAGTLSIMLEPGHEIAFWAFYMLVSEADSEYDPDYSEAYGSHELSYNMRLVPEPMSLVLLGVGVLGLGIYGRRRSLR